MLKKFSFLLLIACISAPAYATDYSVNFDRECISEYYSFLDCDEPIYDLIYFNKIRNIPDTPYTYGVAQIDIHGTERTLPSIEINDIVYVIVPDEDRDVVPLGNTFYLGYTAHNIVLGVNSEHGGRDAWLISLDVNGGVVSPNDIVKFGNFGVKRYDFYHDLSLISDPMEIADIDGDKKPEIMLDFYEHQFRLLLSVDKNGLNIKYKSPYYLTQFKKLKDREALDNYQYNERLLYGVFTKQFSTAQAIDIYELDNNLSDINTPYLISLATDLKDISTRNKLVDEVVKYMRGEIQEYEVLVEAQKTAVDTVRFMELLTSLETALRDPSIDEDAFSNFTTYLLGGTGDNDFRLYTTLSLARKSSDMEMLLNNPALVNTIIHPFEKVAIIPFDTRIIEE